MFRNNFWRKKYLLNKYFELILVTWLGGQAAPHGAGRPQGGEGRRPLPMARTGGGGRRGGRGLRVPAELRFSFYVEIKRYELKAFLLLVHGES